MSEDGLSENTQVKANLVFMLKTIGFVGSAVWLVAEFKADVQTLENDVMRMSHEVEMNSKFRVGWPRGDFGALPDDMEQTMKIQMLQEKVGKLEKDVEKLRYGTNGNGH